VSPPFSHQTSHHHRYNRTMIITNYANSVTKEYMAAREIHFLVVVPSQRLGSFPKALNTAHRFALSLGRIRTAGSSVRDFLEGGDVVMELVGICGQDAGEFPSAMSSIDREIIVQSAQPEEITVRLPSTPLSTTTDNCLSAILGEVHPLPLSPRHLSLSCQASCHERGCDGRPHRRHPLRRL
jgi:hypothetical protein